METPRFTLPFPVAMLQLRRALITAGSTVTLRNGLGQTPEDIACSFPNANLVALFAMDQHAVVDPSASGCESGSTVPVCDSVHQ
jgi:ankyrin repeat protein